MQFRDHMEEVLKGVTNMCLLFSEQIQKAVVYMLHTILFFLCILTEHSHKQLLVSVACQNITTKRQKAEENHLSTKLIV